MELIIVFIRLGLLCIAWLFGESFLNWSCGPDILVTSARRIIFIVSEQFPVNILWFILGLVLPEASFSIQSLLEYIRWCLVISCSFPFRSSRFFGVFYLLVCELPSSCLPYCFSSLFMNVVTLDSFLVTGVEVAVCVEFVDPVGSSRLCLFRCRWSSGS